MLMSTWLDPLGACLSLICTFYLTKAQRFAWLIGICAVILNTILYTQQGLYGSVLLESIYFITMIYGWVAWQKGTPQKVSLPIRFLKLKETFILSSIAIISILIFAQAFMTFIHSDLPYWDATITVLSLMAQWLLCIKVIHCWILWFIVDALVASMQLYKGIPFHSAIHWMYLILAVIGYLKWHKIHRSYSF